MLRLVLGTLLGLAAVWAAFRGRSVDLLIDAIAHVHGFPRMPLLILAALPLSFACALGVARMLVSPHAPIQAVDEPNQRSLHFLPTPRTGGVAILTGTAIGMGFVIIGAWMGWTGDSIPGPESRLALLDVFPIGLWTCALGAVSLWDDRSGVSPAVRLLVQLAAAIGFVSTSGVVVASFYIPFSGPVVLGGLATGATVLFIVWMSNLYNFMDGMDGFAGGMAVSGFGFLGVLALANGGYDVGAVALIVAASAAGFLVCNYPPARLFMGDVGSVPLGFLAATLAAKANRDNVLGLWVSIIIFSPFIVDATVVLIRRALRGEKVWRAHRQHYYQRLVLAGWSQRRVVHAEYILMLACGVCAVFYNAGTDGMHVALLAGLGGLYTFLSFCVSQIERHSSQRAMASPSDQQESAVPSRAGIDPKEP